VNDAGNNAREPDPSLHFVLFRMTKKVNLLEVIPKPFNFAISVLKTQFLIGFGIGSSKIET
jgi:hypothetical protein